MVGRRGQGPLDAVRKLLYDCVSETLQQQPFQEIMAGSELPIRDVEVVRYNNLETTIRIRFTDGRRRRHFTVKVHEHMS